MPRQEPGSQLNAREKSLNSVVKMVLRLHEWDQHTANRTDLAKNKESKRKQRKLEVWRDSGLRNHIQMVKLEERMWVWGISRSATPFS